MGLMSTLSQYIPINTRNRIVSFGDSIKRFGVYLRVRVNKIYTMWPKRSSKEEAPIWVSDESEVWLPLTEEFRFIHEPITLAHSAWFIGRQIEKQSLALRIIYSDGGAFLVTGYRGVGKTSFVHQTLHFVRQSLTLPEIKKSFGQQELIVVHLNLARKLTPAQLMHHVARRTYQALTDAKILKHFDKELQDFIRSAFERTSFNVTRKTGSTVSSQWGVAFPSLKIGDRGIGSPVNVSRKKDKVLESQYSFLGYDDKMAEYDIIEILQRVRKGYKCLFRKRKVKIVFVFDELDKLKRNTLQQNDTNTKKVDEASQEKTQDHDSGPDQLFLAK